ncbi:amidase [Actinoplanes sp. NPDC026619]|uniref:amidase n=1 Tax=Actinoplanes sp. NPDC026619 TaxID=3155798 RepID=UPI0033D9EDC7
MIVDWSATSLSAAIRDKQVSCVEVMTAYLDRIERLNPSVNALVALRPRASLIADAAAADRAERQGWMHGFPFAVKDLADAAGLPTSAGFFRDPPPATADSLHVERIRAAGAIIIGKTNVPEFGLGSHTYNNVFGTTLNAYDQTRTAGGSSGGAAVAVALRMLPVADGSDFMGSLRNPPGWNNVLGLRPSVGRVPSLADEVFVAQSGVEGPIARTSADLALLLQTMSGYDPRAPLSLPADPALTDLQEINGRKVAWLGDLGGYLPMEPEVLRVTGAALQSFADLGITVTTLDGVPGFDSADLWPAWLTLRHWLTGSFDDPSLLPKLKPEIVYEVNGAAGLSGSDVLAASIRRSALYQAFRKLFETYDYAVLPTAQVMPFDATLHWPARIGDVEMTSYHRWMEVSTLATLINAPALAMPAGFSHDGLPIGLQVIGRNHDDRSLLSLAAAWERQTDWVRRVPPPLV